MSGAGLGPTETTRVPVTGGELTVGRWGDDGNQGPVVLALHGITSHHRAWPLVAAALPEHRLVAPDLRGRGGSADLPGPWGLATHADDAAAVLRASTDRPAVVVGHSMGGFVAVVLAHRHPELVRALVLVDGGLPFPPSEIEATRAGLATIRERLETRFDSVDSYVELFRRHPALARDWTPEAAEYARYDARQVDGGARASARVEAVLADQADIGGCPALEEAVAGRRHPATFLYARRGFVDDPPGLYGDQGAARIAGAEVDIDVRPVEDVNHYTIVLSERGAAAVAAAVRAAGR